MDPRARLPVGGEIQLASLTESHERRVQPIQLRYAAVSAGDCLGSARGRTMPKTAGLARSGRRLAPSQAPR